MENEKERLDYEKNLLLEKKKSVYLIEKGKN